MCRGWTAPEGVQSGPRGFKSSRGRQSRLDEAGQPDLGLRQLFVIGPRFISSTSCPFCQRRLCPCPCPLRFCTSGCALVCEGLFGFPDCSQSQRLCVCLTEPRDISSLLLFSSSFCSHFAGVSGWSGDKYGFSSPGLTGFTGNPVGQT